MMNKNMATFRVYDYDVWGNARDGFEVNDVVRGGLVEINTDADLIAELRRVGLIKRGVRAKSIGIEGETAYTLYVSDLRRKAGYGRPEFELRRED